MGTADYISHIEDYSEETQLHFEKNKTIIQRELNPLSCYTLLNGKWNRKDIPVEIDRVRMGGNPYECEFKLNSPEADDVHIIIQRSGHSWFIMDSGKKDLMKVNGFVKRQLQLKQNEVALVQIGNEPFIFSTKDSTIKRPENATPVEAPPLEEKQFSVSHQNSTINFNLEDLCIIGSDPICNFYLPGEQFVATISHLGKRLFLTSLVDENKISVTADGVSASQMPPLKPGTQINIGNTSLNFKLSKDLRFTQSFNYIPDAKGECMKLLEIDSLRNPGHGYILPPAGRSLKIGRNSNECQIAINNSTKISRVHAQSIVYEKSIMLIDNGSTNGTYVNGEKIKRRLVHPGDFVKFGNVEFILCFVS